MGAVTFAAVAAGIAKTVEAITTIMYGANMVGDAMSTSKVADIQKTLSDLEKQATEKTTSINSLITRYQSVINQMSNLKSYIDPRLYPKLDKAIVNANDKIAEYSNKVTTINSNINAAQGKTNQLGSGLGYIWNRITGKVGDVQDDISNIAKNIEETAVPNDFNNNNNKGGTK